MKQTFYILTLTLGLPSCSGKTEKTVDNSKKCEPIQEWKVQEYRIVKLRCPDLVLAFYYEYDIYEGDKRKGNVSQVDSCIFTWQADNESFLTLNACDNSIKELKPHKILLDINSIDSATMFSKKSKQMKRLTIEQTRKFVKDWNNSKTRGYSKEPFDSAFYIFPAYQYRLTVFSKGTERPFYCYNYVILDSSEWKYEMGKTGDIKYFHDYWEK